MRLLCFLQAEQCLPEAPEMNPSVWLLSFQPSLEASVSQRPRGKRTSVLTASTCAHPEPHLLLQPPADGERCLALGTEAAMATCACEGKVTFDSWRGFHSRKTDQTNEKQISLPPLAPDV